MRSNVLFDLCDALRERKLLHNTRYVSVEEQVSIFHYIVGKNDSNRTVADRFQHSGETISRHFRNVLKALCKLSKELITPPDMNSTHPYIRSKGNKYYPWFKNCIGALDGMHISALPTGSKQIPYRGRKTVPTQNVMCACDFDMCFTSVVAGWEGTTNDSRILNESIENP
ncbi:nuclease [Thalictrum thalictroides]|uniref:Nuclease n=1 Tax=Thalictrum thalictroides TaxID=46969 RepID=A0A7J6VKW2_THATH|nr:nuclease [Thalictrum thalictroides]